MSRFFKSKQKASLPPPPAEPRSADEITREYSEAVAEAGKAEYLKFVQEQELERLNRRLLALNQEFAARRNLDAKAAEAKGATNEQS